MLRKVPPLITENALETKWMGRNGISGLMEMFGDEDNLMNNEEMLHHMEFTDVFLENNSNND